MSRWNACESSLGCQTCPDTPVAHPLDSALMNCVRAMPSLLCLPVLLLPPRCILPVRAQSILDHFHQRLAEAQMHDVEVVGLRVYTGPAYFKMNGSNAG